MTRDIWYNGRRTATRPIASRHLIISCGQESEINYFEGFEKFIKQQEKNRLVEFCYAVDPVDPMNMANKVKKRTLKAERDNNCHIDHVWVLFDKDDFTQENFNNAISKIESIEKNETTFHVLWSNQCYELWLLLNFCNMQSAIDRSSYIEKLELYLKEKYSKSDKLIFEKINLKGGNILKAIRFAKALVDESLSPAKNDPATKIYEFFEHFNKYLNLWE